MRNEDWASNLQESMQEESMHEESMHEDAIEVGRTQISMEQMDVDNQGAFEGELALVLTFLALLKRYTSSLDLIPDAAVPGAAVPAAATPLHDPEPAPLNEPHIRIVYHPASGLPEERLGIVEYQAKMHANGAIPYQDPPSDTLWEPFESEADFTFAEFVCQNHLPQAQIDRLIKLLKTTWSDSSKVSFKNHQDVTKALKFAKDKTTLVCCTL
jgi:hypothetical protein